MPTVTQCIDRACSQWHEKTTQRMHHEHTAKGLAAFSRKYPYFHLVDADSRLSFVPIFSRLLHCVPRLYGAFLLRLGRNWKFFSISHSLVWFERFFMARPRCIITYESILLADYWHSLEMWHTVHERKTTESKAKAHNQHHLLIALHFLAKPKCIMPCQHNETMALYPKCSHAKRTWRSSFFYSPLFLLEFFSSSCNVEHVASA